LFECAPAYLNNLINPSATGQLAHSQMPLRRFL
jgi:hypothetical protein